MAQNKNGLLAIGAGALLAVGAIALDAWGSLWNAFGIPNDQRSGVTTAIAILSVNLGFVIGIYFQQNDFKADVLDSQRNELARIQSIIPTLRIYQTYTGDAAMHELIRLIPSVRSAHNTRILSPKMSQLSYSGDSPWDDSICRGLTNGLVFREVVSPDNENLARLRTSHAAGCDGTYRASVLRHNLPSFMNFIVVEYDTGHKDVWFGWIVSEMAGWEGTVIRTGEQRIVALFERWHAELLLAGRPPKL